MAEPTSLLERVAAYPVAAPIHDAVFLAGTPVLVRDDGTLDIGAPSSPRTLEAHPQAAVLCSSSDGTRLLTGGDDGRVVLSTASGDQQVLHDARGKWIDAVALRADGAAAWSIGKAVFARDGKGALREAGVETTARGLAFAPKGFRLAIAHYNGVSLWFPNAEASLDVYEWRGSHLSVVFSPDARFLVTAMQENALHGWRLGDRANMRMSGYPSKVRSLSWSADGDWLATSGADAGILWPFRDRDGPMRKPPLEVAVRKAKVSRVSFHPKQPMLAIGYEDGWILLNRYKDNAEILVRRPDAERDAISALAWRHDGKALLFGTSGGDAGLVELPG